MWICLRRSVSTVAAQLALDRAGVGLDAAVGRVEHVQVGLEEMSVGSAGAVHQHRAVLHVGDDVAVVVLLERLQLRLDLHALDRGHPVARLREQPVARHARDKPQEIDRDLRVPALPREVERHRRAEPAVGHGQQRVAAELGIVGGGQRQPEGADLETSPWARIVG